MQSKRKSIFEAITNTVVGLLVSFMIQLIIYPVLDVDVSIGENLTISIVFLVASIVRSYLIRRIFNKL